MTVSPARLSVVDPELVDQLEALTLRLAETYESHQDPHLLRDLPMLAAEIPAEQRAFVRSFAFDDSLGYCVIRGHRVDQTRIGQTPAHWRGRALPGPEFPEELLVLLYAGLLGEPFGWRLEQEGRLVHDLVPVKEHEHEQMGIGSRELLTLHTEAAFHPLRADYLVLACLRNPDGVATMVSEPCLEDLTPSVIETLFERSFPIHTPPPFINGDLRRGTEIISILFGDRNDPYVRIDPYVMDMPEDKDARIAFEAISTSLEKRIENVVLEPGDLLVINNHRMVHGRRGFNASYNGADRWLKRVNITRDIAKSRDRRDSATARVVA